MANGTASQCERLLHEVELLRIRVDHVAERTPEHDELAVDARKMFIAVGKKPARIGPHNGGLEMVCRKQNSQ